MNGSAYADADCTADGHCWPYPLLNIAQLTPICCRTQSIRANYLGHMPNAVIMIPMIATLEATDIT